MICCYAFNDLAQPLGIPAISQEGRLKNLVEDCAVQHGCTGLTSCLYSILKNSTTSAAEGISNNSRGNQVVRVENQDIVGVVYYASSSSVKHPYDMNICFRSYGRLNPSTSKMNYSGRFLLVYLKKQDLRQ